MESTGPIRITPVEDGLRRRIKGLNQLYEYDCFHHSSLKNLLIWPPDLVDQFLSIDPRPTIAELWKVLESSPLRRYNMTSANKLRGWIPDVERPGYRKRDLSHYIPNPDCPDRLMYNPDPKIIGEFEKLIIKEASLREKIMREIIKSRKLKNN